MCEKATANHPDLNAAVYSSWLTTTIRKQLVVGWGSLKTKTLGVRGQNEARHFCTRVTDGQRTSACSCPKIFRDVLILSFASAIEETNWLLTPSSCFSCVFQMEPTKSSLKQQSDLSSNQPEASISSMCRIRRYGPIDTSTLYLPLPCLSVSCLIQSRIPGC